MFPPIEDEPEIRRELSTIAHLTADQIRDLGRVAERYLPGRLSIRLRSMAERQADQRGGSARLWAGEAALAERFLERETELGIDFDAAGPEDRPLLEAAFHAVQRAGLAIAAGVLIDDSLGILLTTPWRVACGEGVDDLY